MGLAPENFLGTTHIRAMEEDVSKKVDMYLQMLQSSAEECDEVGVDIEVKITAGTPLRKVVVQEVASSSAAWVILDRHLRRELRYYIKHIRCKVALVLDNLTLEILRSSNTNKEIDYIEDKVYYSLSKSVPPQPVSDNENKEQSSISVSYNAPMVSIDSNFPTSFTYQAKDHTVPSQNGLPRNLKKEDSGNYAKTEAQYYAPSPKTSKLRRKSSQRRSSSDVPVLCIACGMKTELDSKRYSYSEIQMATDDFSSENLLGEGGYGFVYKGELKDGQLIAAKIRKEASTQGFSEFQSEVYVLNFARHKNIVMLLGYCCKENLNILVYEYICNKSLEWHLFDNSNHVLDWHRRQAIAVGTAKGLRFLHEECRGSPIIHRDMRPSNILLTHDFVPMLGDFGLAKWKMSEDDVQTRILGTLGYLAPEYAENGIVSVLTDVYSFGIVLIQLISGRKAVDSSKGGQQPSLRQWAVPLIETLALHELVDPRLGESYNTYQMYNMARTAYLCVQPSPEMRPSMAEVLRFLEGDNDHFQHLTEQFIPHYSN
ncbi:serine/threonine-protein kinase CDG1-like isoform X2 [Andrographis paniculata]|nr:serine/threonine-protein kinase CDG1-like isoform X2 [Andrographis paniculata]